MSIFKANFILNGHLLLLLHNSLYSFHSNHKNIHSVRGHNIHETEAFMWSPDKHVLLLNCVHSPLLFRSEFSVSSQPPFNCVSIFIWITLRAKHGRVQGVVIGGLWWDNMPHHTPGISCQAERLLCFHNTLPWIQLANIQVCGDHIIAPSLPETDHAPTRQLILKS